MPEIHCNHKRRTDAGSDSSNAVDAFSIGATTPR